MPQCIAFGVTVSEFWHLTPLEINAVFEGGLLRKKMRDEEAWLQGAYNMRAFSVVAENILASIVGKKGTAKYFEQPVMQKGSMGEIEGDNNEYIAVIEAKKWTNALGRDNALPASPR